MPIPRGCVACRRRSEAVKRIIDARLAQDKEKGHPSHGQAQQPGSPSSSGDVGVRR